MEYTVQLRVWETRDGNGEGYFDIEQAGNHYRTVKVLVSRMVMMLASSELGLDKPSLVDAPEAARGLNRLAVRSIEDALRAGSIEPAMNNEFHIIELSREDDGVQLLLDLTRGEKTCSYQDSDGRDLYCVAASDADETATRFTTSGRRAAPTSRPLCAACSLPDTDYLCSHFLHPQVIGVRAAGGPTGFIRRDVTDGLCDLNRPEFANKRDCHAGGNPCWERIVDVDETPDVQVAPPQAVEQALDDLNVRWRLAFGRNRHVVRLPGAADVSVLALPAGSRDEFERRLSVLADIMKRLDIPDDMFTAGAELPEVTHTHARLEILFAEKLADPDEVEQVKQAVSTLRSINQLRVGGQHGGEAQARRTQAADVLGVPLDGRWGEAWERVRALAAHALREIGGAAQRVADQTSP